LGVAVNVTEAAAIAGVQLVEGLNEQGLWESIAVIQDKEVSEALFKTKKVDYEKPEGTFPERWFMAAAAFREQTPRTAVPVYRLDLINLRSPIAPQSIGWFADNLPATAPRFVGKTIFLWVCDGTHADLRLVPGNRYVLAQLDFQGRTLTASVPSIRDVEHAIRRIDYSEIGRSFEEIGGGNFLFFQIVLKG
jgi:hypothetical protein